MFILCFGVFLHHCVAKGGGVGNCSSPCETFTFFFEDSASLQIINKLKPEGVVSLCCIIKNNLSTDMIEC